MAVILMIFGPPKAENCKGQILCEYCIKTGFFNTGSAMQKRQTRANQRQNQRMTKLVHLTYEIKFLPLTLIQLLCLK